MSRLDNGTKLAHEIWNLPSLSLPEPIVSVTEKAGEATTDTGPTVDPPPTQVIRATSGWGRVNLIRLWEYRDLVWFLTWRDIQLRYRQTALGIAWAVIQPVAPMVIFSVFFGRLAHLPSDGVPYPLFAFCGLLPWQLFAFALTESSNSLVANQSLITKVYFPRLVIPLSSVLAGLLDFAISFVILLGLMLYFHILPTTRVLFVPFFLLLAVTTALGTGLWLSALNVQYRDVRYTIPFLTQFWLYATPIAYSSSLVPARWRPLLGLNPIAGVVEGFRWSLLGTGAIPKLIWVSAIVSLFVLYTGVRYFSKMERAFADIV
jgi:lipopolysaccharide transport system permease protein